MKSRVFELGLLFLTLLVAGAARAAGPVVSNVRAAQKAGTTQVEILYDLTFGEGQASTVWVEVSTDGGAIYVTAEGATGAVGAGVAPGTNKLATWETGALLSNQALSDVRIRVTAHASAVPAAPTGFATIPAGSFTMGDSWGEGFSYEIPTHAVALAAFYLANTETTLAEWVVVRDWAVEHGYPDLAAVGAGKADTHPVLSVSWYDIVKWCNARSEKEGLMPVYYTNDALTTVYRIGTVNITNAQVKWDVSGHRLPTEAEWEYAARGGLAGKRFPWGDTITHTLANYYSSSGHTYDISATREWHPTYATGGADQFPYTSPAGVFAANGYGLFDMAGNVSEWCWDRYGTYPNSSLRSPRGPDSGSARMYRGGSWLNDAKISRTAGRSGSDPGIRNGINGFRSARSASVASSAASAAFELNPLTRIAQTVTFDSLPAKTLGDIPFALLATASSGLPVSFQIVSGPATLTGGAVWLNGVGTVTVRASQAGDATYAPATPVERSFAVSFAAPIVATQSTSTAGGAVGTVISTAPSSAGSAGVAARLDRSGSAAGAPAATLTVETFSGNPTSIPSADLGGGFMQVKASEPVATDVVDATFYYPTTADETHLALLYYKDWSWRPVFGNGGSPVTKDTTDNQDGTVSGGRFIVRFDNLSTPKVTELNGTVFTASTTMPLITSPLAVSATVGQAFSYQITTVAVLPAPFFSASTLPPGLTFDPATGLISGTPMAVGSTAVTLGATNQFGMATATLTIAISDRASQTITFGSLPAKSVVDLPFVLSATASSGLPVTYTSSNPAVATVTGSTVTLVAVGSTIITASQAGDAGFQAAPEVAQVLTVLALPVGWPEFTAVPPDRAVRLGGTTTFTANAAGTGPMSYQWRKEGSPLTDGARLSGATTATLTVSDVQYGDAGGYTVVATNGIGARSSAPAAQLAVVNAEHRLINSGYLPGGAVGVENTLTFAGAASALGWQVVLPPGWSFAAGSGAEGEVKPAPGTTSLLEWKWNVVPASPVRFAYAVTVPAGTTGDQQLRGLHEFRQAGVASNVLALPDPLVVPQQPDPRPPWSNLGFGAGVFVGAANGGVFTSENGAAWVLRLPDPAIPGASFQVVRFLNGKFVAVGTRGLCYTSPDGVAWTQQNVPVSRFLSGEKLAIWDIAYGNGLYLAAGQSECFTSSDAVTWTRQQSAVVNYDMFPLRFGGGRFLIGGPTGHVAYCTNGTDWIDVTLPEAVTIRGFDFGPAGWVAYSGEGIFSVGGGIWTSPEAAVWTKSATPLPSPVPEDDRFSIYAVTAINGKYFLPCSLGILASSDGVNFSVVARGVEHQQYATVTYGNGVYVASGFKGNIYDTVTPFLNSADGVTWTSTPLIGGNPPPARHSADTNRDNRLSLFELTRVIELFNTRRGASRTGCYAVAPGSEDGYAPEPGREAAAVVGLASYHSADSNRDGKLTLFELTRVIELFNYRSGSQRTGQYRVQAGTEDGFAPGP
jgi:formylglycine-generating enzyme required for sulfatase activity